MNYSAATGAGLLSLTTDRAWGKIHAGVKVRVVR